MGGVVILPLHEVPRFLQALLPQLQWQGSAAGKAIYLTFDDGPAPGPTDFVLACLATYKAKATFFAVGDNLARYPSLATAILAQGHTLANHTQNHVKGWGMPVAAYVDQVHACQAQLVALGSRSTLMRPPYGRITLGQIAALQQHYKVVAWSVLSADYDQATSPGTCLIETYKRCQPGAIIVWHDSYKAERNLRAALPALLYILAAEGYQFKAL